MSEEQTAARPPHDLEGEPSDEMDFTEPAARIEPPRLSKFGRCAAQVLWPAFMGAAMSVGLFFSAIDPLEIVGVSLVTSREGAYTLGFFLFWMLFIVSGTITWFLASSEHEKITTADKQ